MMSPILSRQQRTGSASGRSARHIIVECNYLLIGTKPWSDLMPFFNLVTMVREDRQLLERRLLQRWLSHGYSGDAARAKVDSNDLVNADIVLNESRGAQLILRSRQSSPGRAVQAEAADR
ncbi:hypothetical protein [Devosia sp. 2618]|uniref:hypothetical protein n=1 Tax=Devosia sp. 2618 TaxID=3156454 RepID=UPI0033955C0B